ncbi:MAG: sulfatase-like hydrolase/transferase [Methylophilaceae bacterium]
MTTLIQFFVKHRHYARLAIRIAAYYVALFLIFSAVWIHHNFGNPSLEQILYHLQFGMEGLVDTDESIKRSFIKTCLGWPLVIALALALVEVLLGQYLVYRLKTYPTHTALWHKITEKMAKAVYWLIYHRAPLYTLVGAFIYFGANFSLLTYMHQKFGRDYFAEHYLNPKKVQITAQAPKNLVLIYVESLENTYQDEALFGKNLLKSIDKIGGISFNSYRQAPGTGWTIAGITATHCGLPLKSVTIYDGNDQGSNIKAFLPKAVCLGDVLHAHGYHNVYMGGDALSFSGKGKFFQDHHYDEVYGREELKGFLSKNQMNYWGLYDDDLLVKVKAKLVSLHAKKQPFNLTFTTIDTHGPSVHYSNLCKKNGAKDFPAVVECTSNQVTDFMNFIKKNGYLKDTNVVIIGDHLAMYNPVWDKLQQVPERHIYNQFISLKKVTKTRDDVLHFDMFPTILEFIGFHVEGGKLGLGYTAITPNTPQPEPNALKDMEEDLLNESETYIDLWKRDLPEENVPNHGA